jgi:hypothetical protein
MEERARPQRRAGPLLACALAAGLVRPAHALPKVFFLGPGKTATTTITTLMEGRGYSMCHNQCAMASGEYVTWRSVAWARDASHEIWSRYSAFSDNGHTMDFKWLEENFPHSRFVLNTRPLASWLTSRIDFALQKREVVVELGLQAMRVVLYVATHQRAALAYFSEKPNRLNRFAIIDIVGMRPEHVDDILDWVTRRRPFEDLALRVTRPVRNATDLPPAARTHPPGASEAVHRNLGKSSHAATATAVRKLLRAHGCTDAALASNWYDDCARVAVLHDEELAAIAEGWREAPPWLAHSS